MSLAPPQAYRKTEFVHRSGLASARPAAADVLIGTLYFSTDTRALERSNGTTWDVFSVPSPIAASSLLGRGAAGAGAVEAITLSNSLIMTGTTLTVRTGIFEYAFNEAVIEPPALGQVRLNAVFPWTTASKLWLRFVSSDDQDLYWGIMIIPTGATIIVQDKDDHTRYGRFTTTGVPTDKGLYAEVPIAWVANGTVITTAQRVFIRAVAT